MLVAVGFEPAQFASSWLNTPGLVQLNGAKLFIALALQKYLPVEIGKEGLVDLHSSS
jgi:hypothetical protein